MTDRELLELAAKAAGNDVEFHGEMPWFASGKCPWNPLTDDGDALRLAVKLCITLGCAALDGKLQFSIAAHDKFDGEIWEPVGDDPYAATRRAIVRAAAEIGRGMK